MNFKVIALILKRFCSKSFWRKPKKFKYLIVEKSGSEDLFNNNIIAKNETFLIGLRDYEWLNINIFFWLIKENKYSLLYQERFVFIILYYLERVEPKFVLTWMDYILSFYKLKSYYPQALFISLQVGRRSNEPGEFFDRLKHWKGSQLACDYIFSFGEAHAIEYEKYIRCSAIPSGSVRNNNIPISHNNEKLINNEILFISQYRTPKKDDIILTYGDKNIIWKEFYRAEFILLPILSRYCKKKSIRLSIAASIKKDMKLEEKYYDNLIGSENYNFIEKKNDQSNYTVVDQFSYIIGINSTLLYESLARGKRVAFFDCRGGYTGIPFDTFGWPMELAPKGKFWTNEIENGEVEIILDYLLGISENQWQIDKKHITKGLMHYDSNNSLLRKILG